MQGKPSVKFESPQHGAVPWVFGPGSFRTGPRPLTLTVGVGAAGEFRIIAKLG